MSWGKVGRWISENMDGAAGLVGSLLSGNAPAAIATGISLLASSTGSDDPVKALAKLQSSVDAQEHFKVISDQSEREIRSHIAEMHRLDLEDKQKAHEETQKTIRAGDRSEHWFIRGTRPAQSWVSLIFAFGYVIATMDSEVNISVLSMLLALPWAYAGLREVGKGVTAVAKIKSR